MVDSQLFDYSILLTIVGLVAYWFGAFHDMTCAVKSEKTAIYLKSILFLSLFFFVPIIINHLILKHLFAVFYGVTSFPLGAVIFTIPYLVVSCIVIYYVDSYSKSLKAGSISFKKNQSFLSKDLMLIVYSCIIISTAFVSIEQDMMDVVDLSLESLSLYSITLLFTSFFLLTGIAVLAGLNAHNYPLVKVHLKEGEPKEGHILKYGDYLYLSTNNKITQISNEFVRYIESLDELTNSDGESNRDNTSS